LHDTDGEESSAQWSGSVGWDRHYELNRLLYVM
jgi:hypothetical protein